MREAIILQIILVFIGAACNPAIKEKPLGAWADGMGRILDWDTSKERMNILQDIKTSYDLAGKPGD